MNSEKIGKFIYDLRKKYNLTQKELADKLNVTAQAVSKWESDASDLSTTHLIVLSKLFGASTEELLKRAQ